MSWLLKLLGSLSGSIWLYAGIGAALLAAGGYAGHRVQSALDAPKFAQAATDLATARTETAQARQALSDFHAQVERDRADANAKALETQTALQSQITDLTSKVNSAQRARAAVSDQLIKALHAIPVQQQAALSPAVRDALCRVRVSQGNADAATCIASGGSQNGSGIPTSPVR